MKSADKLVKLIRDITQDIIQQQDSTSVCIIQSINNDKTLNIYILPDKSTIIPNVINASKYDFTPGDAGVLYKIKNKIDNAFIIAKYGKY